MCIIAIAWQAHPDWELVVAANRDEYHNRPSSPLGRWNDKPQLLAGRDLRSGGTWLGISEAGRLAAVTNIGGYGLPAQDRPSRGELVTSVLEGVAPAAIPLAAYNPVHLLAIDQHEARILSNRPHLQGVDLSPGIYTLSNAEAGVSWAKTERLEATLGQWLTRPSHAPDTLLDGLREERLPKAAETSAERPNPIFIRDPLYGTRCSSVIMIDRAGQGLFVERRFTPAGDADGDTRLRFSWPVQRADSRAG